MWPFRKSRERERKEPFARAIELTPAKRIVPQWGNVPAPESDTSYTLPIPPPGVVPAGAATMAQDGMIGATCQWAMAQSGYAGSMFPGYAVLSELSQKQEYRRGSEVYAEEMTRRWIKITTHGDAKDDKIKALETALEKYRVRDTFRRALVHDGLYGIGHIFIDVGADGTELAKPLLLSPGKVTKGALKGIRTIEPLWCYPAQYNASDPLRADYYKPTAWFVQGQQIHSSRLMSIIGREVSDLLKPVYMFGGLSRTMMAKDAIENFYRTRQSVADLIHSFSITILKTDLANTMQVGGMPAVIARVQSLVQFRDNRGVFVADQLTEAVENVSTPLGGLDALQAQSQEQIASTQAIPIVKLLGIDPAGLNSTADGSIRMFYDSISADQEKLVRAPLTAVLNLIQLSEFGEIDPEIGFDFLPLWQMSEADQANIQKVKADTAAVMIEANVISPEEDRQRLSSDDASSYHGLDMSMKVEPPADPSDDPEMEAALQGGEPHAGHADPED